MKFRLELDVKKLSQPISHRHKLLLIGSCFTENIGEKLDRYKFTTLQNPNGILFNPVSVAEALINYIDNTRINASELFQLNEAWHSWKHHSRYSGLTAEDAEQKINHSYANAHQFLKEADFVFITLGSAWTYSLTAKAANGKVGRIAANNHKAPADWFQRRLLSTEEVLHFLDNAIHRLFHFNSKVQIIFTISPVRHLREGLIENNRSKAVLIGAVHQLVDKFNRLHYFPAYELVIDDLRDYRFFSEDLVHPNYFATEYVWEKLVSSCMNEKTRTVMQEIHTINLAYKHKPFNPKTQQHQQFLRSNYEKVTLLQQQYPFLDFAKELVYFNQVD